MSHFFEVLEQLRIGAANRVKQGRRFERLIQTALSKHPGIWGDRFSTVHLWDEWERKGLGDTGVDLVAQETDGSGYCAIQCKFHSPTTRVTKQMLDSFLSASERGEFTSRLIVNTGAPLSGNALKTLEQSRAVLPCTVLEAVELDTWPLDWRACLSQPEHVVYKSVKYTPKPFQRSAVDAVVQGFQTHSRGKLILPCGTGKTVVSMWIAEQVAGLGRRVLYLVPSIALMAQTMQEWAWQKTMPHRYIGICSDTRVGYKDEDASLLELVMPVTTDRVKIEDALR